MYGLTEALGVRFDETRYRQCSYGLNIIAKLLENQSVPYIAGIDIHIGNEHFSDFDKDAQKDYDCEGEDI